MSKHRSITLYFHSIGLRQVLIIILAFLSGSFFRNRYYRNKLNRKAGQLFNSACFSYTSGRGALAACLSAAKIGSNDEVILSSYTCLAVPTALIAVGATPVYCDIDPMTLNVSLASVKAFLTNRTKAIVVQHTLGSAAQVEEIAQFVQPFGILVIEDCSLSIGTRHQGRLLGTFGDAAIFSLELSKTISVGWGGILVVNNGRLAGKVAENYKNLQQLPVIRTLRLAIQTAICGICYHPNLFCIGKYVIYFGFKYNFFVRSSPDAEYDGKVAPDFISKIGGIQAALGVHQMVRMDKIAQLCERNGSIIIGFLKRLAYIPLGNTDLEVFSVSPKVSFLVADQHTIIEWFSKNNIVLDTWFDGPLSPLPKSTVFNYHKGSYPKAEFVARHIINIPCHSRLSYHDLNHIEQTLIGYANSHSEDMEIQKLLLNNTYETSSD